MQKKYLQKKIYELSITKNQIVVVIKKMDSIAKLISQLVFWDNPDKTKWKIIFLTISNINLNC